MRGESESNEMIILSAMLVHKHPRLPSKKNRKMNDHFCPSQQQRMTVLINNNLASILIVSWGIIVD